jgi:hypothetical protein
MLPPIFELNPVSEAAKTWWWIENIFLTGKDLEWGYRFKRWLLAFRSH